MLLEPYIPETIRVHLGPPDSDAETVTVNFADYVKNVASSELYPTWPENALRANIYTIVTFALNRIYTEWYPSKGYDFDITNSTQYDQKYIHERDIFENVGMLVDKLFNKYIVRRGFIEPIFAAFCDGEQVQCDGLSQWGTVDLALEGLVPYEILQNYYGENIDILSAPIRVETMSYPGRTMRMGDSSNEISQLQLQLNRISQNYPAIPKIGDINGFFGVQTDAAVREFQKIFSLPETGEVDSATWYKIAYIYASVKKLAELESEGITREEVLTPFQTILHFGIQAPEVSFLQYYLSVLGAYYDALDTVPVTGYYGELTEKAVKDFQRVFGLPETGVVDIEIWNKIYDAYMGIVRSVPFELTDLIPMYPGIVLSKGMTNDYIKLIQQYLSFIHQSYPSIPEVEATGYFGPITEQALEAFQKQFGLTSYGVIGTITWDKIASVYSEIKYGEDRRVQKFPAFTIT